MSDSKNETVFVFATPRRTHTGNSITVRECGILAYLLPKLAKSRAPEGFEQDVTALQTAYQATGRFVHAIIAEAEANLPRLKAAAATGDEDALKAYSSAKKAWQTIEDQRSRGQLDELFTMVKKAAAVEEAAAALVVQDTGTECEGVEPDGGSGEAAPEPADILATGDLEALMGAFTKAQLEAHAPEGVTGSKRVIAEAIIAARS